jgi:hypothetical protein
VKIKWVGGGQLKTPSQIARNNKKEKKEGKLKRREKFATQFYIHFSQDE